MKLKKKIFSVILSISIFIACLPCSAIADTLNFTDSMLNQPTPTLTNLNLPDAISYRVIEDKQHVRRRYDLEADLNTAIFENETGTKTAYIFPNAIKYIDDNGNIKDRSTEINSISTANSKYVFAAQNNVVKSYYPANAYNGVTLKFGKYSLEFYPNQPKFGDKPTIQSTNSNNKAKLSTTTSISDNKETNRISYPSAFGANTCLQYTPLISGLKEDIIIYEKNGTTKFEFVYKTNGLSLIQNKITVYLLDKATGKIIGEFNEIVCYDSKGKISKGSIDIKEIQPSQEYLVTISIDDEFLSSDSTKYPVYVDPTISIWEIEYDDDSTTYNAIVDKGIYTPSSVGEYLSVNLMKLGTEYEESDSKIRMLVGISNDFVNNSIISSLDPNQITSAALVMYTETGEFESTVFAYPYNSSWTNGTLEHCSNTATFNNYLSYISDSTSISGNTNDYCDYDITNVVSYWADGSNSLQTNGLILINSNEGYVEDGEYLKIASVENVLYDTYITIDYTDNTYNGEFYLLNKDYGHFLTTDSNYTLFKNTYSNSNYQRWVLSHIGNNKYIICSKNNVSKLLYYTGSGVGIATRPSTLNTNYQWTLEIGTGGIIITNVASGKTLQCSSTGTIILGTIPAATDPFYNLFIWRLFNTSSYVNLTNFIINSSSQMNDFSTQSCSITPTPAAATLKNPEDFSWSSSNSSLISVSNTGVLTSYATNGSAIITATHKSTGITKSKTISVTSSASEYTPSDGLYFIADAADNEVVLDYSTSIGTTIIDEYDTDSAYGQYIWYIRQYSPVNKTFLIYSMSSMDSYTKENNHVLTSNSGIISLSSDNTVSNSKLWKFYKNSSGDVYIQNQNDNQCLTLSGYSVSLSISPTKWKLTERNITDKLLNDHCFKLFPHGYTNGDKIKYVVTTECGGFYSDDVIEEGVKLWNNISSNILIVMDDDPPETFDEDIVVYVTIKTDSSLGTTTLGRTQHYNENTLIFGDQLLDTEINIYYTRIEILLTTRDELVNASNTQKKSTICHEMGHALSLRHIDDAGGMYDSNTSILSVMNYSANNRTYIPSWLDKESVQLKWGD